MSTTSLNHYFTHTARSGHWSVPLELLAFTLLVLFVFFWPTFLSMAEVWWRSETFAHGFLIFPISLYLIWRRLPQLSGLTPQPDWRGLVILAGLGFGWLLARVVDVQVVQQLCFVAMIVALVWTMLGWQVLKQIAFPLGFLFFAVPIGEFLIPPLMNFTADFTVMLIELTGIPVYREGTFFSIPSGDWSVVEGCSGLRYLIASITVGCLYAYLTYRSLWRRLAFIVLSIGFPVIANGLRAFMIVMIAHFSDMKLALGVDHYIYGWVFFGLVMLLMFWIGSFWREDEPAGQEEEQTQVVQPAHAIAVKPFVVTGAIAMLLLVIWPIRAGQILDIAASRVAGVRLDLPQKIGAWRQLEASLTTWQPHYLYPDAKVAAVYSDGQRKVGLYVYYYRTQSQGKELVNSQNMLVRQKHPVWKMPWEKKVEVQLPSGPMALREGLLQSGRQNLLVWRWNWISGRYTISEHLSKLLEAKDKLLGSPRDAAGIIVTTEYDESSKAARQTLRDFTSAMLPAMRQILEDSERSG